MATMRAPGAAARTAHPSGEVPSTTHFVAVDRAGNVWVTDGVGKDGKGTTPVAALGPVDQHSQLQLFIAGPRDKLITLAQKNLAAEMRLRDAKTSRADDRADRHPAATPAATRWR